MNPTFTGVGKTTRMKRIFGEDGKALMVAINHGLGCGPINGIEDMDGLLKMLVEEKPDSLTLHKGIALRHMERFAGEVPLILKCTNATRFLSPEETGIAQVEEAVTLGADAIALGLTLCSQYEGQEIERAASFIRTAEKFGMPTVTHSYPSGGLIPDSERHSVENVKYAVRVSLELGVDIIKTFWTGSGKTFEEIVRTGEPAKVVISGGPLCHTTRECFEMTKQGMDAGAAGITYGRNIWQSRYPAAVLRGLRAIVHDGATVDRAMELAGDAAGCHLE